MLHAAKVILALLLPAGSWGAVIERPAIANVPEVGFIAAPLALPSGAPLGLTPSGFAPTPSLAFPSLLSAPAAQVSPAVIPALAAALVPARAISSSPSTPDALRRTKAPRTVLQTLRADVPFDPPKAGDLAGQKDFADRAFAFKAGGAEVEADARGSAPDQNADDRGSGGGGNGSGGGQDDGGGAGYPSRQIHFRGQLFRTVLFRPNVPVEADIVRAVDAAQKSVHLALYEFKLSGVLDALRRARNRGVEIHIVLDHSNVFPSKEEGSDYDPKRSREIWALLREGFDVKVLRGLGEFGINHNKIAIIDQGQKESLAVFGSFNWSWTAENSHYENANFSTEKDRIRALKSYWDWLEDLALPVDQAKDHAWPAQLPAPPVAIAGLVRFNGVALPSMVLSPQPVGAKSIEDRVVEAIDASRKTVDIAAFCIRSTLIAEALKRAVDRGLRVRVIFDEGQSASAPFGPYAQWLTFHGVELKTLAGPDPNSAFPLAQKTHHKFGVFDGKLVETGSANHTKYAARANFENAHFLEDAVDVAGYAWIFERMFARAKPFPRPEAAPALPTDAELQAELSRPPKPAPAPVPVPAPGPGVGARTLAFNGNSFPSYAFRPDTTIKPMVVAAIDAARHSVRMALYEFNLDEVLDALRRAKKRGLKIELVIDRSHLYTTGKDHSGQPRKPSPQILALIDEGFDILTLKGKGSGIQHNKLLLVDAEQGGLLMFGSYNVARTAEENHFENVRFTTDKDDTADYLAYFTYMRGLAQAVDRDKLDEVLSKGLEADAEEASPESATDEPPALGFPPPPQSKAPPVVFNDETFRRSYFSPQGGVLDAWIRAIGAARESVEIAMFGFYAREAADAAVAALTKAKAEGRDLKVRFVLDSGQSALAKFDGQLVSEWLAERGIDVRLLAGPNPGGDPMFEKQHNKFMVVDGKLLVSGSFNLSSTAENLSFENDNLTLEPRDVAGYAEFFARMFTLGRPPRGAAPKAPALAGR